MAAYLLRLVGQVVEEIISTCTVGITLHALKGQKLLAQGNALGYYVRKLVAL